MHVDSPELYTQVITQVPLTLKRLLTDKYEEAAAAVAARETIKATDSRVKQ